MLSGDTGPGGDCDMGGGYVPRAAALRPRDPRELGSYTLEGRLGEGGMGFVYLGRSAAGRLVAIKVIRSEYADDPEFRMRFRSEVERAQQVPSYCTAEVLDSDPDHDPPFLVVEYVDGPSLSDVVRDRGPLSPGNLHGLAIGVAAALTAIHGAGVIHRDLKPSNVLLAPGSPKVIDFGIARPVDAATGYTRSDQIMGTVAYMSPERFGPGGGKAVTPAADIFAWGAVVAFAGTGRVPFDADSLPAMAYRIMTEPPELEGVTGPLRTLVEEALAKDPRERPTARQLLDRLTAVNAEATTVPTPRKPTAPLVPVVSGPPPTLTAAVPTVTVSGPGAVPHWTEERSDEGRWRLEGTGARASGGERRSRSAVALFALGLSVVLAGGGVGVAAGMYVDRPTAASGTSPTTAPPTSAAASDPSPPPGAIRVQNDALAAPGPWQTVEDVAHKATCSFDGRLVATSEQSVTFRCKGPPDALTDTAVFVDVTLVDPGTCAAVWFRFTDGAGGYALRICEDGYHLVTHAYKTGKVTKLRDMPLDRPVAVGTPLRVGIVVQDTTMTFYRDGVRVDEWKSSAFAEGRVVLGLLQSADPGSPPYRAAFAHVVVWGVPV
jgi:eukaryotic-like serine/threonine-protein kinase